MSGLVWDKLRSENRRLKTEFIQIPHMLSDIGPSAHRPIACITLDSNIHWLCESDAVPVDVYLPIHNRARLSSNPVVSSTYLISQEMAFQENMVDHHVLRSSWFTIWTLKYNFGVYFTFGQAQFIPIAKSIQTSHTQFLGCQNSMNPLSLPQKRRSSGSRSRNLRKTIELESWKWCTWMSLASFGQYSMP